MLMLGSGDTTRTQKIPSSGFVPGSVAILIVEIHVESKLGLSHNKHDF